MSDTGNRRHFDVSIPHDNCEPVILELLGKIAPQWAKEDVQFRYFTDGISNKLVGCIPRQAKDEDLIMFRLYGNQTELFIDRKKELENVEFLHARGFAPRLYCTFVNGYCCGFLPGRTLDTEEMSDVHLSELIAKKLAHLHAIKLPSSSTNEPCVFQMLEKFSRVLPQRFEDPAKQKAYEDEILSRINVVEEVNLLKSVISKENVPMAYCHNDLLVKNIIYNKEKDDVAFIDYEYGAFNYNMFDIGNHFNEFGGVVEKPDYTLYPNKEFQLRWLRIYAEEKAKVDGSNEVITDDHIEKIYRLVNIFSLLSHLFWGAWGLLQANFSAIDFNFLQYSKNRFDEYLQRKEEFLNL